MTTPFGIGINKFPWYRGEEPYSSLLDEKGMSHAVAIEQYLAYQNNQWFKIGWNSCGRYIGNCHEQLVMANGSCKVNTDVFEDSGVSGIEELSVEENSLVGEWFKYRLPTTASGKNLVLKRAIIPSGSAHRLLQYHWWRTGQSITRTMFR